ncbi:MULTISPECIES: IS3 family transposase [unclassified Synechococcus]|uniref:IS3 family transposase n=1 Tax=unclassified Synechococcus TaxID=2626047 RepID=UPI001F1E30A3|nr:MULTISPECIES: IS3 family transposase [unclassified Synechococcus]MCT4366024.1 IS3 family transposase [Candidatus Regnicoccus frigidus MAG-AL1]MCT4367645.1 IS3 family transposase [Candidatus Regnicoccus frigidus MAG-AL2]
MEARFSVSWLCRQLGLARSGYYAWRQRQENPGSRAREDAVITAEIQEVFQQHRGFYGSPRVHQELAAAGRQVGRHRVARLMRRAQLQAKTRKAFRPCRKASSSVCGATENLLQQDFQPSAPNRSWAGDITYIRTKAGWRYLAVWIDLFSRRVVGWKLDSRIDTALVIEALNRALGHRQVEPEKLLIHTDQGSQYRATDYRDLLEKHEIVCSMSAKGCCWDNAVVESFFSTLKFELDLDDDRKDLTSPQQLQNDLAF